MPVSFARKYPCCCGGLTRLIMTSGGPYSAYTMTHRVTCRIATVTQSTSRHTTVSMI